MPTFLLALLPAIPVWLSGWVLNGAIAGVISLLAFGANWWFDITDLPTAAIFIAAVASCALIAQTKSPWARFAIAAIIAVAAYLKAAHDTSERLTKLCEEQKTAIHAEYKRASDAERARQQKVNDELQAKGEAERQAHLDQIASLKTKVETLTKEASNDANAKRKCLGVDSVKRLNKLRGPVSGTTAGNRS